MLACRTLTNINNCACRCGLVNKLRPRTNPKCFFIVGPRFVHSPHVLTSNDHTVPQQNAFSSEEKYLVKIKDDPDTFGLGSHQKVQLDEGDIEEYKYFEEQPDPSQKLRTKQYADIIKGLIRKRQIKEAIDVLEQRMIKEDRVKPEAYIYNLILGACGRVGYTKKAFSLYNDMKKRGYSAMGGTYTALFNACANSPWPEDGLSRARHLREIMIEKRYEPNDTNYNVMIKAFGRCGDLNTAFSIADEMASKGFRIRADTLAFLLQAAITDKAAGFRHSLLIWRKFHEKKIKPTTYTYNLMLRCIRDCGLGDIETTTDVIKKIASGSSLPDGNCTKKLIGDDTNDDAITIFEEKNKIVDNRPNLMQRNPHLGNIISLTEVTRAEDRLILVGGFRGFLKNMEENDCAPDIKTFTLLLDSMPNTQAAEFELLHIMQRMKVKKDVDFYNMLIKRRSMRFDFDGAKAVVEMLKAEDKRPDLITYGVLSLACRNKEEALQLIDEMKRHNYRLNIEILGAMLHQACHHKNFSYINKILDISQQEQIKPSRKFLNKLEEFKKSCKVIVEQQLEPYSKKFERDYRNFRAHLKQWLEKAELDELEDVHPWQQFRQKTDTDVRHYKDKNDHFKARHASLFKVKTSKKKR